MKITLTAHQVHRLMPYFDRVRATAAIGSPGMLVAQLRHDSYRGVYTMEPCFLDHDKALPLEEAATREIPK